MVMAVLNDGAIVVKRESWTAPAAQIDKWLKASQQMADPSRL